MSKVYNYYSEGEEPCCPSIMETSNCACGLDPNEESTEPSDAELLDIEANIDDMLWDDDYED